MTTTNQEVKTGVFYVLDSKFDVVFDGQETRRLFVLNIGFLWVYSEVTSIGLEDWRPVVCEPISEQSST